MKHSEKPYEYQELEPTVASEAAVALNYNDSLDKFVTHSYDQYKQGTTLSMEEVKNRLDATWGAL